MRETTGLTADPSGLVHPLDIFEYVAGEEGWEYERAEADVLVMDWQGAFGAYHLSFSWMEDIESLHLSSPLDMQAPPHRVAELIELMRLINEQLWVGHFDFWMNDGVMLFRHSLLLSGGSELTPAQCQAMVELPVSQWDLFFQAFQYVIWAGKKAKEALDLVQFVTEGEA